MYMSEYMATADRQKTETKKIIFVVDRNLAFRLRLVSLLQNSSQDVKTFESAENFLVKLDVTMPDCLVIGSRLPGMSAIDLLHQLQNQGDEIPVIVMGEENDVAQAVSAMRAGAVDFIGKPFTNQKLRVCV